MRLGGIILMALGLALAFFAIGFDIGTRHPKKENVDKEIFRRAKEHLASQTNRLSGIFYFQQRYIDSAFVNIREEL